MMKNEEKIISLLEIVVSKVDNLEYKMDNLEYKFDSLEFKVDGQEYKTDAMDRRIEKLEARQSQAKEELITRIDTAEDRILKLHDKHIQTVLEGISRLEGRVGEMAEWGNRV